MLSKKSYTANGIVNNFTTPTVDQTISTLEVYLNSVLQTSGYDYDPISNQIIFTITPVAGTGIDIVRKTDITNKAVDFNSVSILSGDDLNLAVNQLFQKEQELEDADVLVNVDGSFDFKGNRLSNVGTPIVGTDAATRDYVNTTVTTVINTANVAEVNSSTFTDLATCVASASSAGKRIVVSRTETLLSNLTIPIDRDLYVDKGGLIVNGTFTLTINGNFDAPLQQCFSGTGVVTLRNTEAIYPKWWGADGDNTDETLPVQAAFNAAYSNAMAYQGSTTVKMLSGTYSGNWVIPPYISIIGEGPRATRFHGLLDAPVLRFANANDNASFPALSTITNKDRIQLEGFMVYGQHTGYTNQDAIRIETTDGYVNSTSSELYDNCTLRNIAIRDMAGKGLVLIAKGGIGKSRFIQNCIFDDIVIEETVGSGLYLEGGVIETSFRSINLRRCGSYISTTVADKFNSGVVISAAYARPYVSTDGDNSIALVSFPQRLNFQNLVSWKGQPVTGSNTGIGIYINAGSSILFTSTDLEEQYIGIEADSYYPVLANGTRSATEFPYQTIFDVTTDKAIYNNGGVPLHKAISINKCINFNIRNNYSYGTPSAGGSYLQYGVYISAWQYEVVQNVTIDTQSKFGYTFWYDRRAQIVQQWTPNGRELPIYGAGMCLVRVNVPFWNNPDTNHPELDEPHTYLIEKIALTPNFDPPTGTRVTFYSGYPMVFNATALATTVSLTHRAYLNGDFTCSTLNDTLTLEWRETLTGTPVVDAQNNGAWYEVERVSGEFSTVVNTLKLGNNYLWTDATGKLRIKNSSPISDTDGTVVGTQT